MGGGVGGNVAERRLKIYGLAVLNYSTENVVLNVMQQYLMHV